LIKHHAMKTYGGVEEVSDQLHASGSFAPRKEPPTPTGGWVGPKVDVKAVDKRRFPAPTGNRTPIV